MLGMLCFGKKKMNLKIKKLAVNAVIPEYQSKGAAGIDLTAISKEFDPYNKVWVYGTGLAVEIPKGHVGLLFPRSSIYRTSLSLVNSVGVIDSDYRGEIKAMFKLSNDNIKNEYYLGDRIIQLVIIPIPHINIQVVEELSNTERGEKGFGSSGK